MPLLGRQGQAAVRRHAEACTSGKTASACQAFQEGACPEADAGCGEPLAGLSQRSRCLPAISAHLESGPWKDAADWAEKVCRPDIRMRHRRTLDGAPCLPCGSGNGVNAGCKRRACRIQRRGAAFRAQGRKERHHDHRKNPRQNLQEIFNKTCVIISNKGEQKRNKNCRCHIGHDHIRSKR